MPRRSLLGADEVDPALQEPADVGEVGLLLLGVVPELAHLVERELVEVVEVAAARTRSTPAPAARRIGSVMQSTPVRSGT